jgi:hypothetical protein
LDVLAVFPLEPPEGLAPELLEIEIEVPADDGGGESATKPDAISSAF